VHIGDRIWPGALNIGVVPTFRGSGARSVEVHVLGFEGDLYGSRLDVDLVERLREERRFAGPDELVAQIRADLRAAAAILEGRTEAPAGRSDDALGRPAGGTPGRPAAGGPGRPGPDAGGRPVSDPPS
jgi:hypothetical protein